MVKAKDKSQKNEEALQMKLKGFCSVFSFCEQSHKSENIFALAIMFLRNVHSLRLSRFCLFVFGVAAL